VRYVKVLQKMANSGPLVLDLIVTGIIVVMLAVWSTDNAPML
jgi:hypothetical protein